MFVRYLCWYSIDCKSLSVTLICSPLTLFIRLDPMYFRGLDGLLHIIVSAISIFLWLVHHQHSTIVYLFQCCCSKAWCCYVWAKQVLNMSIKQQPSLLLQLWGSPVSEESETQVRTAWLSPCQTTEEAPHQAGLQYSEWDFWRNYRVWVLSENIFFTAEN